MNIEDRLHLGLSGLPTGLAQLPSQSPGAGPMETNEGGGPGGGSLQADVRGSGVKTIGWRE